MSEYWFRKTGPNTMEAATDEGVAFLSKCKLGADILIDARRPRNYAFHKRIFALIKFAYENTELPEVEFNGEMLSPNLDGFRKALIIRSGFYTVEVDPFSHRLSMIADSINYKKCSQEKAERIYSAMLDRIAKDLFDGNYTREELEKISETYLGFI